METKMTVIVDNVAHGELAGEWGLSILVEYGGKNILVDAGASPLFATNMEKLGLDMAAVDYAVLSHAHYDHANGMIRFFQGNNRAKFYVQQAAREDCYGKRLCFRRYIGMPRGVLTDYADRIVQVSGKYELLPGAYLLSHTTPGLAAIGARERMYRRTAQGWRPDDFAHEQSLVLETDKGLVIINSCSHGGAVNIIREVREAFPDRPVYGIIGGFHLYNKKPAEVRAVARELQATGVSYVCTGHCTRERACDILEQELGDKLHRLRCGLTMTF